MPGAGAGWRCTEYPTWDRQLPQRGLDATRQKHCPGDPFCPCMHSLPWRNQDWRVELTIRP